MGEEELFDDILVGAYYCTSSSDNVIKMDEKNYDFECNAFFGHQAILC